MHKIPSKVRCGTENTKPPSAKPPLTPPDKGDALLKGIPFNRDALLKGNPLLKGIGIFLSYDLPL